MDARLARFSGRDGDELGLGLQNGAGDRRNGILRPKVCRGPAGGVPRGQAQELVKAIAEDCEVEFIGIRPGGKLHEILISEDEARHTMAFEDMFVIQPLHPWWNTANWVKGGPLPEGFRYGSDTNQDRLSLIQLQKMVKELEPAA